MGQLPPGARIDDRYRIVGPLGAGGMGVVYRARDEKLGRQVALKMLPKDRVGDEKARARLRREARAAAALEHPGIAAVYDVGEAEDGGTYLVMELVRGRSLRDRMRESDLTREAILSVIGQVADTLDHAHASGVIHRDIKPENIMVRDDGRACLLDFGLVKDLGPAVAETVAGDTPTEEHLTKEGTLIGTLSYLAPEQARGRGVGPRSDQFALATTAYEALAGQLPWDGENAAAVLAQILVDDAPPPSSLESTLPLATDRVFARALAKSADDRFESCTELAEALARSFDPSARAAEITPSSTAAPSTETSGAAPWVPWAVGGGGVLAIALAVGLLWDAPGGGPDPDPTPVALGAEATVACPVLDASGVQEPSAWLGVMAAHQTCERLTWWLGGDPARTRVPAELIGLPEVAGDDFPEDPWIEDGVAERTRQAARELDGWIDGRVVRDDDGAFVVELALRAPGVDAPLAQSRGEAEVLYLAVAQAVDALAEDDALPTAERLDEAIAPYVGTDDIGVALAHSWDLGHAALSGIGAREACHRLIARREALGPTEGDVRRSCLRLGVAEAEALQRPALDRSSIAALALTAAEQELPEQEARAIAAELAEARGEATHPFARATIAKGEIMIWERLGDFDRARDLLLTTVRDTPRDWFLRVHLVRAMLRTPGAYAATRALAAWSPDRPEAWRTLALPLRGAERSIPWLRRAYLAGGALPIYGIYLSHALIGNGHPQEVRAIAARYATSGESSRVAGEYLRARVEAMDGRFGRAFERMLAVLLERDSLGRFLDGDTECVEFLMQLATLLGRDAEAADPLAQRFVLAEPHRLMVDQPHYEIPAIAVCMRASEALATPCLARLRALREAQAARAGRAATAEALLTGAEAYVSGDREAAVRAWRPLVRRGNSLLFNDAFEPAGELGLLDRHLAILVQNEQFGGLSHVHPMAARRAAVRGEHDRARALAEATIRAWGTADVELRQVDEMRALLASLPDSGD